MKEKCKTCGPQERVLKLKEPHIYAYCSACGTFIKFVPKDEVDPEEIVKKVKTGRPLF
jgi:uncharacterized Zn finger protein